MSPAFQTILSKSGTCHIWKTLRRRDKQTDWCQWASDHQQSANGVGEATTPIEDIQKHIQWQKWQWFMEKSDGYPWVQKSILTTYSNLDKTCAQGYYAQVLSFLPENQNYNP